MNSLPNRQRANLRTERNRVRALVKHAAPLVLRDRLDELLPPLRVHGNDLLVLVPLRSRTL